MTAILTIAYLFHSDLSYLFYAVMILLVFISACSSYYSLRYYFTFYENSLKQFGILLILQFIFFISTDNWNDLLIAYFLSFIWLIAKMILSKLFFISNKLKFLSPDNLQHAFVSDRVLISKVRNPNTINLNHYDAVLCNKDHSHSKEWQDFIACCQIINFPVHFVREFDGQLKGKLDLTMSDMIWSSSLNLQTSYKFLKRILDLSIIFFFSPVWLPLFFILNILILIRMGRPIYFTQMRVGIHGKPFVLYKFRSMLISDDDAETKNNDGRITKFGHVLRKYRLDEIPQFFNVIKGNMSLIGPRPERVDLTKKYIDLFPIYAARQIIKPGITGWAQVHQGYAVGEIQAFEKISYDLYYIKHFSLYTDVCIFFKTIKTLLNCSGSR